MESTQLFTYGLLAVVILFYIRKYMISAGIKHYTARELKQALNSGNDLVLLDVRTTDEHRQKSIKGSLHIPLQDLVSRIGELQRHEEKEIVCYCQSGSRSLIAAGKLKKYGFRTANLRGGMTAWNFSNLNA